MLAGLAWASAPHRYGCLGATDEEVKQAARSANAHDFVSKLPQKYDTVLQVPCSALPPSRTPVHVLHRVAQCDGLRLRVLCCGGVS